MLTKIILTSNGLTELNPMNSFYQFKNMFVHLLEWCYYTPGLRITHYFKKIKKGIKHHKKSAFVAHKLSHRMTSFSHETIKESK